MGKWGGQPDNCFSDFSFEPEIEGFVANLSCSSCLADAEFWSTHETVDDMFTEIYEVGDTSNKNDIMNTSCWICGGEDSVEFVSEMTFEERDYDHEGEVVHMKCSECGSNIEFSLGPDYEALGF